MTRGTVQRDTQISGAEPNITRLEADVKELKTKLGDLEEGISSILQILKDGP